VNIYIAHYHFEEISSALCVVHYSNVMHAVCAG